MALWIFSSTRKTTTTREKEREKERERASTEANFRTYGNDDDDDDEKREYEKEKVNHCAYCQQWTTYWMHNYITLKRHTCDSEKGQRWLAVVKLNAK